MRSYITRLLDGRTPVTRRYRYVFVVTYGRSGSTLLMGILNTIPGYRVRGENLNALYRLYQADAAIRQAHRQHAKSDGHSTRDAWYGVGAWRPDKFRAALVDNFVVNVLRPAPGDRVLGFKEIRYTEAHIRDLREYVEFLRVGFPQSKIIFNHRRPADVAKSGWWASNPQSLERIKAADERMLSFPADDHHFHFYYDDVDDSLDNIRALLGFLGEDIDEKRIREALATKHSYSAKPPEAAAGESATTQGRPAPPMRRFARRLRGAARAAAGRLR